MQEEYFSQHKKYNALVAERLKLMSKSKRQTQQRAAGARSDQGSNEAAVQDLKEQILAQSQAKTKLEAEIRIFKDSCRTLQSEIKNLKQADHDDPELLSLCNRASQLKDWMGRLKEFSVKLTS